MMADRSTVVVTGGAGFIGSELVRQLAARGERVVIVDNLVNGKRENVADVLSRHVTLLVADVRDVEAMAPHLRDDAGRVSPRVPRRAPFRSLASRKPRGERDGHAAAARGRAAGRRAAVRLRLELGGVRRRAVHADPRGAHRRGSPGLSLHRSTAVRSSPASRYARAYFRTYGYPTVVVRPFNTYGPRSHHEGDSGEVIPKFLLRCLAGRPMVVFGDGSQSRDFTYVSDTAAGILLAGEHPDAVGRDDQHRHRHRCDDSRSRSTRGD